MPSEYLNIINNILCMTRFLKLNISSSLSIGSVCSTYYDEVIILMHVFYILIIDSRCVSQVFPHTSTQYIRIRYEYTKVKCKFLRVALSK